jgi:hypothetical protein
MMSDEDSWRVIVVGGHTRTIGKTQLVCDLIAALPEANWVAGKITQYGHGVCTRNGKQCDCAPDEHICAITWEARGDTGTDSARFLAAGAARSFWLRTKQGFLPEGFPLLRAALREAAATAGNAGPGNLILESNTLLQFLTPSLYLMVVDPGKSDFKHSARLQIERASAVVWRRTLAEACSGPEGAEHWSGLPLEGLRLKPQFLQREGEGLPSGLTHAVRAVLEPDSANLGANRGITI